ncbi:putative Ferric/cupric reductase transmembrane component 2 [Glarea lozoyensis 74030]|uniref:ferric-chelate reductase (NADPH) n=1 Tax=Glarea lozoyensis (strain ATCC 74030 / MF5533) TaxID=1104152 RepID=H0ETQ5_GLAL7|nr:putative Ferric/cupric reductase transmembrane component 2 [Glarea lozoyensis 74030]
MATFVKAAGTGTGATTGGNGTAAAGASTAAPVKDPSNAAILNQDFYNYIFIILASLVVALTIWRVLIEVTKYVRTTSCLNNERQAYFAIPSSKFASLKKHFFINWSGPLATVCKEVRNRTGILSVVNMVPLFIMAARNNPLMKWLNLSFDTFNLLHRWQGRIVVIEAVAHTAAWMVATVSTKGWAGVQASINTSPLIMWGLVGTVAFVFISIQASSILRHAFYETFKYLHIASAILAIIAVWYHLKIAGVPQIMLVYGVVAIWVAERTLRIVTLIYRNVGSGGSKTLVEALPGNACRVTIDMARPWTFKPGQHAYLYMPSIGLFQSHPFSVAWSEEAEKLDNEKLAMNRLEVLEMRKTTMSFIIRARTGFTAKLCKKAEASPDGKFYTKCFAEGPYGGMHMMHSYGTVMLFAGGVGITHQVPHVRDLVAGYANGTVAARKIVLVWIIQSPEHLEWIRPWMTSILAMDQRRESLRIMLFISRPRSTKEIHSPSATVQMFPGRPNIETLIDMEMENQIGAMGVTVCGSGALSDDVRSAVRKRQHAGNLDFIEEAFSW